MSGVTSGPSARHTEAMPRPKHVPASDLRLPDALQPGRPKGEQLREILESVANDAGPGRLMPSERFLAEHFGVARGTVRQEINRLVSDGVLYRQHGTATFTAERQAAYIDMLTSFTEDMKARGVVPKTKVLHAGVEPAMPRLAGRLNVPPGARVFRLERLRYVADEPFAVERTNLSVDRFPDIELFDWETQSLHRTLEERWGVHAEWNDTAISAVLPDSGDAACSASSPPSRA
jgi:GntR family transcriptional regulator